MRLSHMLVGLGVVAVVGCAKPRTEGPRPEMVPALLVVENNGFLDRTVFIVRSGLKARLGIAPGHQRTEFTIPQKYLWDQSSLSFLADPIGGPAPPATRNAGVVNPGDRIVLTINVPN